MYEGSLEKTRWLPVQEKRIWTERVNNKHCTPSKLWRSMTSILCREKDQSESGTHSAHTVDAFLKFFENKVHTVRSSTEGYLPAEVKATTTTSFMNFHAWLVSDVRRIIVKSPTESCNLDPIPTFIMKSPTKSCNLYPIPTFILKESLDALLPFLTAMCNASILEGYLPHTQKHAIITPILKKTSLDPGDLKNYWPVSNLLFQKSLKSWSQNS